MLEKGRSKKSGTRLIRAVASSFSIIAFLIFAFGISLLLKKAQASALAVSFVCCAIGSWLSWSAAMTVFEAFGVNVNADENPLLEKWRLLWVTLDIFLLWAGVNALQRFSTSDLGNFLFDRNGFVASALFFGSISLQLVLHIRVIWRTRMSGPHTLALSYDHYKPGDTVKALLKTSKQPSKAEASLSLYSADSNGPDPKQELPVDVGIPAFNGEGWQTAIEVKLPINAQDFKPGYMCGWILSVSYRLNGCRQCDEKQINLQEENQNI